MRFKLKFKIKNWKLTLLGLAFVGLFTGLGCWQLSRAHDKQNLINSYSSRIHDSPYTGEDLNSLKDWRFYRVQLTGYFDNQHAILLDNKTYRGKVGYDIYVPFHARGLSQAILVNRGFLPLGASRRELPMISPIKGPTTIIGMINLPPLYVSLGHMSEHLTPSWPLRVQFINLPQLATLLNDKLFPYVVNLDPKDPRAYASEWKITTLSPDKHLGYAVQWFALAGTLLILSLALNRVK